jgi:hypothetical protein
MTWVAVAVVGAAVIGGVASNQAADKQADATKKGIKSTKELAAQARNDAIGLFQQGQTAGNKGIQAAMDFYKNSANAVYKPYIQGNVAAQDVIGQGAQQANNAILGLPVDMGFTQPRQITPDLSYLQGAKLPAQDQMMLGGGAPTTPAVDANGQPVAPETFSQDLEDFGNKTGFGGGKFMGLGDKRHFELDTIINNPLRLNDKDRDKLDPIKGTKKLIKKLF